MSKEGFYIQCYLVKDKVRKISFIMEKLAKRNMVIRLKESDGTWTEGWVVKEVYPHSRMDADKLTEISAQYRNTRDASDI
jgi:hypothetical protein